jgi:flagellar biogenesis protein FliO
MQRVEAAKEATPGSTNTRAPIGGLAGWLLERMRGMRRAPARLAVLERISLAPRQSLALVEAEGRRFLVATSPEGTPAFYALDGHTRQPARSAAIPRTAGRETARTARRAGADRDLRVSW